MVTKIPMKRADLNSKPEIRNSKQIQVSQVRNSKIFLNIWEFEFSICFGFGYSNFEFFQLLKPVWFRLVRVRSIWNCGLRILVFEIHLRQFMDGLWGENQAWGIKLTNIRLVQHLFWFSEFFSCPAYAVWSMKSCGLANSSWFSGLQPSRSAPYSLP